MYLKMHYYIKFIMFFFLCFRNYVSKKCIARHVLFSHFQSHIYNIILHTILWLQICQEYYLPDVIFAGIFFKKLKAIFSL